MKLYFHVKESEVYQIRDCSDICNEEYSHYFTKQMSNWAQDNSQITTAHF